MAGCGGSNSGSGGGGGGGGTTITPTPTISSISPAKVNAGAAATALTVTGTGFVSGSLVEVGGTAEATTYVSATSLTATVPATQLTTGAEIPVEVTNGSTVSTPIDLEVDNPAPVLSSASATTELAGTPSAVITFSGSGFNSSTVINVNGSARATTYIMRRK